MLTLFIYNIIESYNKDTIHMSKELSNTVNDKIIIICATGRSGSTTLQRIINTIPNSNICGENDGMILSILETYVRMKVTEKMKTKRYVDEEKLAMGDYEGQIKPAWYNSYDMRTIKKLVKVFIIKLFKKNYNVHTWGFKEIRFIFDLHSMELLFVFKELFPQTKVIIHIKSNVTAQAQSSWWKEDSSSFGILGTANNNLINFYERCDFCYLSTFENMTNKTNVREMFNFIDSLQHYDDMKIQHVLNSNLGRK
jgi:hypothetical protein